MSSGIYKITNTINNKIYIGSAVDLCQRWSDHKSFLRKQKHQNKYLQQSFNKHGQDAFIFTVLMYCDKKDLLFFEQRFIDFYFDNCKTCYNISPTAGSTLGKITSTETKKKLSLAKLGNTNAVGGKSRLGQKNTIEHNRKQSDTKGITLIVEQQVLQLYYKEHKNKYSISKLLNIGNATVHRIIKRNTCNI